ncbi:MAG: hypothetical protein COA60_001100 [Robiginitomaculum sp.]|nr:hypothetical protein [Robiginitomaculum sp.]
MIDLLMLLGVSVIAIFLIALLIQWLFPFQKAEPIDIAEFEQQLNDHHYDNQILQIVTSKSGKEAIAKLDNNELAFLRRLSEKYSLRIVKPEQIKLIQKTDLTIISFGDFTWPSLTLENQQWQLVKNWLGRKPEQSNA